MEWDIRHGAIRYRTVRYGKEPDATVWGWTAPYGKGIVAKGVGLRTEEDRPGRDRTVRDPTGRYGTPLHGTGLD